MDFISFQLLIFYLKLVVDFIIWIEEFTVYQEIAKWIFKELTVLFCRWSNVVKRQPVLLAQANLFGERVTYNRMN